MSNELELRGTAQVATNSVTDIIGKLAMMPTLTLEQVAIVERLVVVQERQDAQRRKEAFFAALARVQAKAPRVRQNGTMDRGPGKGSIPYAKMEDIDAVMRPIYQSEGFTVTWDFPRSESLIRVIGRFSAHGHTEEREWSCSPDTSGGKQNPQAAGSTDSYGMRYVSKAFWNVIEEGKDTNGQYDPAKVTFISAEQAREIQKALEETASNVGAFLKLYGVSYITDIKQSQVDDVWKRINAKRASR